MSDTIIMYENGKAVGGEGHPISGGGHTIQDNSGTAMPQEENLQFVGIYTEDDATNDRTKVNIVREMTSTQMQSLTTAQKKGFIRTTDEPDNPISGDILAEKTDIAPVESTSIASQAHAKGSQFYFNGQLVTATANISIGGTITLNENCVVSDSVTEQINALDIPKIARGRASFTNSGQSVSLNYSSAGFTEAPTVMVVIEGSRSYARAEIGDSPLYVSNVTKNNCTVEVNRIANNNQIAFYYLAVGK